MRKIYSDVIYLWFSNKSITAKTLEDVKKMRKEIEVPKTLSKYTNDIIKHAWERARVLIPQLNMKKEPPKIVWQDLTMMKLSGLYAGDEHAIYLDYKSYNLNSLNKAIEEYLVEYKIDKEKAINDIRYNYNYNNFLGDKVAPVTLIHEFGHAVRGESHDSVNAHGSFFNILGEKEIKFFPGCNLIWRTVTANFMT